LQFLRPTDPPARELLRPEVLLGSLGLTGFAPKARGTAGTAVCLLIALGLFWGVEWHGRAWLPLAGGFALLSWLTGALLLRRRPGIKDPGWFVLDEAAGFFLVLALIGGDSLLDILAGFLTFRFYDIAKPWPVRSFERISGSLGILADDLAAAVLAAWTWHTVAVVAGLMW
jgi:phosphatidylglycerophosphatase A